MVRYSYFLSFQRFIHSVKRHVELIILSYIGSFSKPFATHRVFHNGSETNGRSVSRLPFVTKQIHQQRFHELKEARSRGRSRRRRQRRHRRIIDLQFLRFWAIGWFRRLVWILLCLKLSDSWQNFIKRRFLSSVDGGRRRQNGGGGGVGIVSSCQIKIGKQIFSFAERNSVAHV